MNDAEYVYSIFASILIKMKRTHVYCVLCMLSGRNRTRLYANCDGLVPHRAD